MTQLEKWLAVETRNCNLFCNHFVGLFLLRWTGASVLTASEYHMSIMNSNPEEHLQRYTGASLASRDMAFAASSWPQSLRRM